MENKTTAPKKSTHNDVYAIVTNKIIEQLEKGTVPWQKPWTEAGIPKNLTSGRAYRGINVMLLASLGYETNLFLTSKQLKTVGGSIRPDAKPHIVVYWNYVEKEGAETEETEQKKVPLLRYYTVFNIAQCDGVPTNMLPAPFTREVAPIPICEKIVADMPHKPRIQFKEQKAYYDPRKDFVNMPKQKTFTNDEAYYCTLFHELVHSTGHNSRLNRKDLIQMSEFGSEPYSHEELVAEIGTCYLQSLAGLQGQFEQSAAYIQGWLKKLKNDRHFIVSASSHAQKAVDYIMNVQPEKDNREE